MLLRQSAKLSPIGDLPIRCVSRKRVIRTRLKRQNFGIFRLVIFARRRALLHLPHQNLLKIESFSGRRILRERIFGCCISKNAGNPNGLPSIGRSESGNPPPKIGVRITLFRLCRACVSFDRKSLLSPNPLTDAGAFHIMK